MTITSTASSWGSQRRTSGARTTPRMRPSSRQNPGDPSGTNAKDMAYQLGAAYEEWASNFCATMGVAPPGGAALQQGNMGYFNEEPEGSEESSNLGPGSDDGMVAVDASVRGGGRRPGRTEGRTSGGRSPGRGQGGGGGQGPPVRPDQRPGRAAAGRGRLQCRGGCHGGGSWERPELRDRGCGHEAVGAGRRRLSPELRRDSESRITLRE